MTNSPSVLKMAISVAALMIYSSSPAMSKCFKTNPLFGNKYQVADKHCPKRPAVSKLTPKKKKTVKASAKKKRKMAKASPKHKKSMRVASSDRQVQKLQLLLNNAGYNPGSVDGQDGPQTHQAALAFKSAVGLDANTSNNETIKVLKRISGK